MRSLPAVAAAFALAACGRAASAPPEPAEVQVSAAGLRVRPDSHLLDKLQVSEVGASGKSQGLRMIGQVIALANPAVDPAGGGVDWLELDPAVSRGVGLDLRRLGGAVGDVIGLTELPLSYADRTGPGSQVTVGRYGLPSRSRARVLFLRPAIHWGEDIPVVFRIENDSGWLPGSNCEVSFPLLRSQGVRIPTTALLHEGIHEFVLRESGPRRFLPRMITIGEGDPDQTEVITGLAPGERIVARGAILLKPFLHQWLTAQRHPDAP